MLCSWAQQAGATECMASPESDEPIELPSDDAHRAALSYYNPLSTESGANVLRRWRGIEQLWEQAKLLEATLDFLYSSVLLVRDDDYWLSPYILKDADFEASPSHTASTTRCCTLDARQRTR